MTSLSRVIKSAAYVNNNNSEKGCHILQIQRPQHVVEEAAARTEQFIIEQQEIAVRIVRDAEEKARWIEGEALGNATRIRAEVESERAAWNEERLQFIEVARQEGYSLGMRQGTEDAQKQYEAYVEQAKQIVHDANKQYYEQLDRSDEAIVQMSLKIAERVIAHRLERDDELFLPLVKQALKETREQSEVKIYVHPESYALVSGQKDEFQLIFAQPTDLFIYPDESLPKYGCAVESVYGRIDASVDTQLQQLKEKLLERVREE